MLTETQQQRLAKVQSQSLQSGRIAKDLIKLKCIDCIYDPKEPGNVNVQIRNCTCESCPFHPIRELWT